MVDILLATLVAVLLTTTVIAAAKYYKLIRRAQVEYGNARDVVEDVVLSFNRELRRETEKLDLVAYKIEGNSSKIEKGIRSIETLERKIVPIEERLSEVTKEGIGDLTKLTDVSSKVTMIEETNNKLRIQITNLEEQVQKLAASPEVRMEPVIPIRRDKALSALTETEIVVLEFLSTEGAKTAPEIKEKVQLSREHTARLMKKLYEEGYLERETGKIPFKYSVKKEMEKLMASSESQGN